MATRSASLPESHQEANRGHTDIKLRKRGTKKVHVITDERVQVDKPKDAPALMADRIWMHKAKQEAAQNFVYLL